MRPFEQFHLLHDPPIKCRVASQEIVEKYKGILPEQLIAEWQEEGWCGFAQGLLWLVNPDDLQEPLAEWLEANSSGAHAFVRTAFGDVIFWTDHGIFFLDVNHETVFEMTQNIEIVFHFSLCDEDYLDNAIGRKLFREALRRLGPLEADECYGFVPAIPLGGPGTVETLQKVKLREYLSILAQIHQQKPDK